jgi:adenosylcobinamide-phosphate synthase
MLGYRTGRLRWLGTVGARLDDGLTWIPCRLTALTLPLVAGEGRRFLTLYRKAAEDGEEDPSPNAGLSQAIYAHVAGVRLGGANRYGTEVRTKPILAPSCSPPRQADVRRILQLSLRLEGLWLVVACPLLWLLGQ